MTRKYIIVTDDSIKGFDEEIAKLEREWGAEEIEPCDDCISRTDVKYEMIRYGFHAPDMTVTEFVEDLPSVIPSYNSIKTELKPCDDCVSREALRQKLEENQNFFVNAYDSYRDMSLNDKVRFDEINNCIAMVVNAPSVTPKARWIPVSERLPEEGQKVLATDMFEAVTTAIYFRKSPFWREMVFAWMPLPEPYEESEEETWQI